MNFKKFISSVGIGAGAIAIGFGLQFVLADWSPAPGTPPNCTDTTIPGCNAPINVSSSYQTKSGGMAFGGNGLANGSSTVDVAGILSADKIIAYYAFMLNDTNSTPSNRNCTIGSSGCENGYVLMNDGSGNAKWVSLSSLGIVDNRQQVSGTFTNLQQGTSLSINIPYTGAYSLAVSAFRDNICNSNMSFSWSIDGIVMGSSSCTPGANIRTNITMNTTGGTHSLSFTATYHSGAFKSGTWTATPQ
ncbi:MAG: hypothetical protein KGJ35_01440 [Patescibacteria group bacterium]|nr:hypothetical protein [Patescibacteria group bacterium]